MNRRWQANKIGLINFWYYDEQEFPFVKGRMLLRGSNGSGKSVTMQSVVPLLLDGNMSPERLDPFGSRDRKMSSYLLEENDGREERTGYLYLEFRRKDSETYLTIGMGIRARRGKPLDKWYFSLTDGRRIGKDFFLYKEMGEKVTLSKKELENRILQGGKVFDRQADYMEYVNKQIFGFETVDEYKEMVDLLIQLRTPKLSKDFKPSVINDILSDSLQPLSDEDLRPMSEAIENMDTMSMNLKSRKEAKAAAEKINAVFSKYNKIILCDKAARYEQTRIKLQEIVSPGSSLAKRRILIVEDDTAIREGVAEFLKENEYEVFCAEDGEKALEILKSKEIHLALLDIMLPKKNGIEVLKELRTFSELPVIMLTAVTDEETQVQTFDNLADDYICKPFSLILLLKRIEALLRARYKTENTWKYKDAVVDFSGYRATYLGKDAAVTPKEIKLLAVLLENAGQVVSRDQILDRIWGEEESPFDRVVDVYVKNLRKKLQLDCIITVKGVGYKLELP